MYKLLTIVACSLAVACAPLDTAAGIGGVPPPGQLANQTKLDEKAGIAVETMYTATVKAGALAFRARMIEPSTNPTVRRADFCALVASGQFAPTDTGARVNALECQLRAARDLTRSAYDAGNGDSYDAAAREAVRIAKELLALFGGN